MQFQEENLDQRYQCSVFVPGSTWMVSMDLPVTTASAVVTSEQTEGPQNIANLILEDTVARNGSITTENMQPEKQEIITGGLLNDDPVPISTPRDAQHICGECGKAFREAKKLRRHAAVHDSVERYTCEVCGRGFKDSSNYNRHLGTHSDRKQHVCSVCLKNFQNPQTLSKHSVTRHAAAKRFMCDVCQSGFNDSSNFKRHLRIHTNEVARFVCGFCREKYPEVEFLKDLTSTLLQPNGTKTSVNGLHICRVCNKNLAYPLSRPPRRSLPTNGGEKKHVCPTCGKRFSTTGHLKQHSVVHGSVSTSSSQVSI